jgi:hypothetical protein
VSYIIKDPLFGVALEDVFQRDFEKGTVPFIQQCLAILQQRAMNEQGLFRESGSVIAVDAIQKSFESTGTIAVEPNLANHAVASCLKKYFRELPEPVIPFSKQPLFLDALRACFTVVVSNYSIVLPDETLQEQQYKQLVNELPPAHKATLQHLMKFLHEFEKNSEVTKMTASNLGTSDQSCLLTFRYCLWSNAITSTKGRAIRAYR